MNWVSRLPMSSRTRKTLAVVQVLLLAGLFAWGIVAWWTIRQARQAGAVLQESLASSWPENGCPRPGTRQNLFTAAEDFRAGDFRSVAALLGPARPLTAEQQVAATRFFAKARAQRAQFIAAATAAEAREDEGADASPVRDALARALLAAADNDAAAVASHIKFAEGSLEEIEMGPQAAPGGSDSQTVAALVARIGPAFNLGRELMTEGHAAAEKLVAQASRHSQAGQFRQAAFLISLAAELLGVESSGPATAVTPKWFDALAQTRLPSVTPPRADAAVKLSEAMAASEEPAETVMTLIEKARRQLDAGRTDEAYWWASVALNALGMTDEAIAAATEAPDADASK